MPSRARGQVQSRCVGELEVGEFHKYGGTHTFRSKSDRRIVVFWGKGGGQRGERGGVLSEGIAK